MTTPFRCLLLIALLPGCGDGPDATPASVDLPLTLSPESLDFGDVWVSDEFQWTLSLQNLTDAAVPVDHVSAAWNCRMVELPALVIPPGAVVDVPLTIDLSQERAVTDRISERVDIVVRVFLVDRGVQEWTIHGLVQRPFALSRMSVDFTDPVSVGAPVPSETLILTKHPLTLDVSVEENDPLLHVSERRDVSPPDVLQIEVRRAPGTLLGPFRTSLSIRATTEDKHAFGPIDVPVTGAVEGPVSWSPDRTVLSVGEFGSDEIVLQSTSGDPFQILDVECDEERIRFAWNTPRPVPQATLSLTCGSDVGDLQGHGTRATVSVLSGSHPEPLRLPIFVIIHPSGSPEVATEGVAPG